MADYDAGEITDRERLAADRQKVISRYDALAVKNQLASQMENYDKADQQNAALRDVQLKQLARKNETDRFEAQRQLQNATIGLLGSMGNQAMNSSAVGNTMSMLRNRNDSDNNTYWQQLMDNQNQVYNAYNESLNQNNNARRDALANATKAIQDIENNLSANLNNINPNLYISPGSGEGMFDSTGVWNQYPVNTNLSQLSGYIMPANAEQAVRGQRNKIQRNDYFGKLMNQFNGR